MMRAQEVAPTNLEVLLALGVSHTNELEQAVALKYLYRWLQNHPKYGALAPPEYGSLFYVDIARLFIEAAKMSPEDSDVHIVLGVLYNLSREYDKAIDSFQKSLKLKPRDYSLWNKLGATQANSVQSADAISAYQQALDLKPNYVHAWANLGISYANQGLYEESIRYYVRALVMNPKADNAWQYLRISLSCASRNDMINDCGKSRLEDAGDCLSMAECWSLAAEVYSKAKCFSKCLSICSKAELLDEGLHFLKMWKQDTYLDENRLQELDELEMSYLESCALHFYEHGNYKYMMNFIKAFRSMDLIRSFLKSNGLLNELLVVEVERGNFLEAATIAKIKGDILQEAEMLEKACHFWEATKLILFHVIVSSLWAPGSKGWPLRMILQNEKLLVKAKQLAGQESDTDSFYRSVCSDVYILSPSRKYLMDLLMHLAVTSEYQTVRLEVFILRSILDFI